MKDAFKKGIPQICGVYFFRDKNGQILYIGKAANLKARISSYFNKQPKDVRIAKMLELATNVDWREIVSEIEALILESQLIKKYRPPFNVILRDDKQYFYVVITKDEYPKILITHRPEAFNGEVRSALAGPFTDGGALKTTLRLLRRIFPYCTCKQRHNNYCLNYHIGKCLGFCCLKNAELKITYYELRRKEYKRNINAIKEILEGKKSSLIKKLKKETFTLGRKYEFEKAIELRDKVEKLEKTFLNAQILLNTKYKILDTKNKLIRGDPLAVLQDLLSLPRRPYRIEGYDISNIQGQFATGAMIVFINGQPDKNEYRKFKIRLASEPNDVAMLKEVLTRRFNHPEWRYPDLIIIDGGRAQLGAVCQVGPKKVPIIALTKDNKHRGHHIYLSNKKVTMPLNKLPEAIRNLILQIDTEAHRFAITYYRKLHKISTVS